MLQPEAPMSASALVVHYEEALYQVYGPLPLPLSQRPQTSTRGAGPIKFLRLPGSSFLRMLYTKNH